MSILRNLFLQETLNIRQILEQWFSRKKETEDILWEINSLTAEERMILEYRDLDRLSRGEMENKIFVDVKNEVSSIIDQHYYTAKIQRFIDRYDVHG